MKDILQAIVLLILFDNGGAVRYTGIHIGCGAPGAPYISSSNYRAKLHSTLGLEEALGRFTPQGKFVETVTALTVNDLPKSIIVYVKGYYSASNISEGGRVTDDS